MTKQETILNAIVAALTNATPAGSRVRRDNSFVFSHEDMPIILLDKTSDEHLQIVHNHHDWHLNIELTIIATGAVPKAAPEPTREAMHQILMANAQLGGLSVDIIPDGTNYDIHDENPNAGIAVCRYIVHYKTDFGFLN